MRPTRRQLLITGAAVALMPRIAFAATEPVQLTASVKPQTLPGAVGPSDLWLYNDGFPLILRARRGEAFKARFTNRLAEHSTIHWHGVRVPYRMDGVPYFTQEPVKPDESFLYEFSPPDP